MMLLLEGTVRAEVVEGGRTEPVGRQQAPTWMHAIAVLTGGSLGVRMTAETPCRIGVIEREDFRRLAFAHPSVHDRVMRQVAPVMSRITAVEQNRERLASLGTMAAGLAHELNNPAAAARRASAELAEAVDVVVATLSRFVEAGIERDVAEQLVALQAEALRGAEGRSALDALDAADAEDELRDELEALGLPEAWRLAEPLAAAGVGADWLARTHALAGAATDAAVAWVAATLTARTLAADVQESTARMSALVGAVKSYAYMDRGDLVQVDLHEGLETTLAVLGHKLKHTEIEVARDYDREPGEADRARIRAQPGVDEPARQRDRRSGRPRHDHDPHGGRARRGARGDRRRRPGDPARVARAHLRLLLHDQGGRPGHRARAGDGPPDRRRPPRRHAHRRL